MVPSCIAVPGRAANQGGPLAAHDMVAADAALHAGTAKLQGFCPAAQLRTESGVQLPGAPVPSGSASVSSDSTETQGHQMTALQETSIPSSPRPRGAGHSAAGELPSPTAQALTASSMLLAAGPHLLGPDQERSKRRGS